MRKIALIVASAAALAGCAQTTTNQPQPPAHAQWCAAHYASELKNARLWQDAVGWSNKQTVGFAKYSLLGDSIIKGYDCPQTN